MRVNLSAKEVEFLKHILDQWQHEEDQELSDSVYAKLDTYEPMEHADQVKTSENGYRQ